VPLAPGRVLSASRLQPDPPAIQGICGALQTLQRSPRGRLRPTCPRSTDDPDDDTDCRNALWKSS
jgi:hypothetical protein